MTATVQLPNSKYSHIIGRANIEKCIKIKQTVKSNEYIIYWSFESIYKFHNYKITNVIRVDRDIFFKKNTLLNTFHI